MRTIRSITSLSILAVVLTVPAVAFAATGEDSVTDLLVALYRGVLAGQYVPAAALALSLSVILMRRLGVGTSALGAGLLTLAASAAGAVTTAIAAGEPVSWSLGWAALRVGVAAAGGYSLAKVAADFVRRRAERWAPSTIRSVILAVVGLFGRPNNTGPASTRAETSPE